MRDHPNSTFMEEGGGGGMGESGRGRGMEEGGGVN